MDEKCKKLGQGIGVINKMKRHLPIKERKLYYNAIIKQVMMYGNTIWSPSSFGKLERVYKLQKRAARIILNADTKERSAKLFKELKGLYNLQENQRGIH